MKLRHARIEFLVRLRIVDHESVAELLTVHIYIADVCVLMLIIHSCLVLHLLSHVVVVQFNSHVLMLVHTELACEGAGI